MAGEVFSSIKKIKVHVWILLLIMAVGIFLRAYHFHDWLQFSPDQARDATIVGDAISGKSALPLLGPIAGGTSFHLGPAFYYFNYASALIFGNTPEAMAYPDLVFAILSIPLFYFFLKKYFSANLSLALMSLYAVSFFAVEYSRFSWNPNLIPFFVLLFLYAILEISDENGKRTIFWPILAGIGLGIGIQLHTLLLLTMPVVAIAVGIYLFFRKKLPWKSFLIIFLVAFFLNVPQVISETKTGGANIENFFAGAGSQSDSGSDMVSNAGLIASCQTIYNIHMISSFENKENCGNILAAGKFEIKNLNNTPGNFSDMDLFVLSIVASVVFSIGGYFLWGYYWWKESNKSKRNFLGVLMLFHLITVAFFVVVASRLSMRYYIILFIVPFVLLGLWAELILENKNMKKYAGSIAIAVLGLLVFSNIFVIARAAGPFIRSRANNGDISVLGEIEPVASYIAGKSGAEKEAYLSGERLYLYRFSQPLEYLTRKENVNLSVPMDGDSLDPKRLLFYIAHTTKKKYRPGDQEKGKTIEDVRQFGTMTVFVLR